MSTWRGWSSGGATRAFSTCCGGWTGRWPRSTPLAELLARVNRLFFAATAPASYATLVVLRVHPEGRIEMVDAGHTRPLLADARGVRPFEGAGLPRGDDLTLLALRRRG